MGKEIELRKHPNYKRLAPFQGETPIAFALRYAAHLVSPPKVEGESDEIQCQDVAKQIRSIESEVEAAWAFEGLGSEKLEPSPKEK